MYAWTCACVKFDLNIRNRFELGYIPEVESPHKEERTQPIASTYVFCKMKQSLFTLHLTLSLAESQLCFIF